MPLSPVLRAVHAGAAALAGLVVLAMAQPGILSDLASWSEALAVSVIAAAVAYAAIALMSRSGQSERDSLTGLLSAQGIERACKRELTRSRHFGRRIAAVVLEVEGLPELNESHGKRVGDAALREMARLIEQFVRDFDLAARLNGGRFALVLPESDLIRGASMAEQVRELVVGRLVEMLGAQRVLRMPLSAGVAVWHGGDETWTELLARAQAALLEAKRDGGNRTHTSLLVSPARRRGSADLRIVPRTSPGEPDAASPAADPTPATERPAGSAVAGAAAESRGHRRLTIGYALLVGALGLPVLALALPSALTYDPQTLAFFLVLVAITEWLLIDLFGKSSYSVASTPVMAVGMLLGPLAAVLAGVVVGVVHALRRRPAWFKTIFNTSVHAVTGGLAALVFFRVASGLDVDRLPLVLAAGAAAGAVHYTQTLFVAVGIGVETRQDPRRVWVELFGWQWPEEVVLGVLAVSLALAYQLLGPLGAAVFMTPALMMRFVAKQYVDRTLESVRQLRELNQQLRVEIAQRALAEQDKARLAREAAEASALRKLDQLKTDLLNTVSHELRTPLTLIHGFAELLALDARAFDVQELRRMGQEIHRGSSIMQRIVDDLLDYGRIEGGRLRLQLAETDLVDLVRTSVEAFSMEPGGDRLALDLPEAPLQALVDPARVGQVLANFVTNALRYASDGPVVVRLAEEPPHHAVLEVLDEGPGLPPDVLSRVWEMFYRGPEMMESPIRGAGIGLAVVKNLVEAHGGVAEVESEPGQGAIFRARLPLSYVARTADSQATAVAPRPLAAGPARHRPLPLPLRTRRSRR